ncbi:MAG TPA: carboxypeptidase regulatory-like domain-containing protein [bacterium]|nr:carboxypeptidase regulatory-like domain-containing protein [bacterium]
MPFRQLVASFAIAIVIAAVVWWALWPDGAPLPGGATTSPRYHDSSRTAHAELPPARGHDETTAAGAPERSSGLAEHELLVHLRGLHPDAGWTGELHLYLDERSGGHRHGRHHARAHVDERGDCRLPLPRWWRPGIDVRLRVQGHSPGYRELLHRERGALPLDEELRLDVEPVVTVTGWVRNVDGTPVACARVTAFAMRGDRAIDHIVGECGTGDDGAFRLLAPPDRPLLLIACAMRPIGMRWRRVDGVTDGGEVDSRYLPATLRCRLATNAPRDDLSFVLAAASTITGRVTHPDGSPVAGAQVRFEPDAGAATALALSPLTTLLVTRELATPSGVVRSDANGEFAIPCPPGRSVTVDVAALDRIPVVGELPRLQARAPQQLDLAVPFATTLRAVHQGQLVPFARILFDDLPPLRTDPGGQLEAVIAQPTHVRADRGALRSPRYAVGPADAPSVRDLSMAEALVEVAVEFTGANRVRNATFHWRRDDGAAGMERLQRGDAKSPFRLWLEPGRYELRATALSGERNGAFLLATRATFEARAEPVALTLPARFGGTFTLEVLDEQGRRLGGSCRLRGPDGQDLVAEMAPGQPPGAFPSGMMARYGDLLPPGDYELVVEVEGRSERRRTITIRPRELTQVVLRP